MAAKSSIIFSYSMSPIVEDARTPSAAPPCIVLHPSPSISRPQAAGRAPFSPFFFSTVASEPSSPLTIAVSPPSSSQAEAPPCRSRRPSPQLHFFSSARATLPPAMEVLPPPSTATHGRAPSLFLLHGHASARRLLSSSPPPDHHESHPLPPLLLPCSLSSPPHHRPRPKSMPHLHSPASHHPHNHDPIWPSIDLRADLAIQEI